MLVQPWRQLELDLFGVRPTQTSATCPELNTAPTLSLEERLEAHTRRIAGHLTVCLPEPVDLVLTDNHSTMISYKRREGRLCIRLHQMFQHADPVILDALAIFIAGNTRRSSRMLDAFIAKHQVEVDRSLSRRPPRLETVGKQFDLSQVLQRVCLSYFGGPIEVAIGWGQVRRSTKRRRRGVRSRALATYSFRDKCIRVSPVLDAAFVPEFVMDWIIYHELLHHVLPIEGNSERKIYHSQRFRCLERAFPRYEEAMAWERANLAKLLS